MKRSPRVPLGILAAAVASVALWWTSAALASPSRAGRARPLPTPVASPGSPRKPKPVKPVRRPTPASAMLPVSWTATAATGATGASRGLARFRVGSAILQLWFPTVADAQRQGPRLAARLSLAAATRSSLALVSTGSYEGSAALIWKGRMLFPVTPSQAREAKATPAELVSHQVVALRHAAQDGRRPAAMPSEIVVPRGGGRLLALPDSWLGIDALDVSDPSILTASAGVRGENVLMKGLRAGVTTLRIGKKQRQASVEVRVLEPAGRLPARVSVSITGAAPDAEFLEEAVGHQLEHLAHPHPGAEYTPYWSGSTRGLMGGVLPVTAWLEGPELFPVVERVLVAGQASPQRGSFPERLAASNNPERIERPGVLLDVPLGPGTSAYYYHHQNAPDAAPHVLQVRLENRSGGAVHMVVTPSGAGPSKDELYAGHLATWRYLRWMTRDNGWHVRLGPGESYVLDERLLRAGEVGCGMGRIMVCEGTAPAWVVEALETGMAEPLSQRDPTSPPRPSLAIVRGRGVFPPPLREIEARYEVDGPYAFIPVGAPPYQQPLGDDGTPNIGNYGVEHRIRITLSNPTAAERRVYVVFAVAGGVARGSLVIDGRLVETPVLSTRVGKVREFGLADYLLKAGENRQVEVRAFPEPGSNYPVRLIAKPLPANQ